jgi:hypothetical protein
MVPHHELEEIGSFEHPALAWELMENASTPSLAPCIAQVHTKIHHKSGKCQWSRVHYDTKHE